MAVPTDLKIICNAGGGEMWEEHRLLQITADGKGSYMRYLPSEVVDPPLEENTFTLSQVQVAEIWNAIETNSFFYLDSANVDSSIIGGSSIRFSILANGITKVAYAKNQVIWELDSIIAAINRVTPTGYELIYEPAVIPAIIPKDVCETKFGLRDPQLDPDILRKMETSNEMDFLKMQSLTEYCDYHPGSVVACRMSIQDAVASGIATLGSKHEFNGDAISITVDNRNPPKCNNLNVKMYLEFYGPTATPQNVQRIKSTIETYWNSVRTSDGRLLNMEVVTRLHVGETTAPGTSSYHQIKLVDDYRSYVSEAKVNKGICTGIWETGKNASDRDFPHEAGHLMGLPDRYTDYTKQADGKWLNAANGKKYTNQEVLDEYVKAFPGIDNAAKAALLQRAINYPIGTLIGIPDPNQYDDIMGSLKSYAKVHQSDVDEIASKNVGIFIEVPPGTPFIPKNNKQSLISTRLIELFVPLGQSRTCGGLFASCIDGHKSIPAQDSTFDIGPSLDTWQNIEAASLLLKLVRYIDEQELYCSDIDALHSIWRITDNIDIGKSNVDGFLQNAGITLGTRLLDFPRMTSPDSTNPTTNFVIPPQLYLPKANPTSTLTQVGGSVRLFGSFTQLSQIDSSAQFGWSLIPPDSSKAKLVNPKNDTLAFTPDVRGVYYPALNVTTQKSGRSPFTVFVPVKERVVATDAFTETFESGTLQNKGPFFWTSSMDSPWRVIDTASHSGKFAVQGTLSDGIFSTELTAKFFIPDSDQISFAFWIPSDGGMVDFYINSHSIPTASFQKEKSWNYVTYPLTAGENTLTWFYYHLNNRTEVVFLDDIFFPRKASFTPTPVTMGTSPKAYTLSQNFPNPFTQMTNIDFRFSNDKRETVLFKVYDVFGREVLDLSNKIIDNTHVTIFNSQLPSPGVYYYRLIAPTFSQTKSMLFVK